MAEEIRGDEDVPRRLTARGDSRLTGVLAQWVILTILLASARAAVGEERPNVLFIAVDDLRPLLGCYGDKVVRTPNIDRLAAQGSVFLRAYCQVPQCGPSRLSLMTGLRPETSGNYSNRDDFKFENHPDLVTLPEHFKKHGYHTQSYGKIYHDGADHEASWSVPSSPGRDREMWEVADEKALAGVRFEKRALVPTLIPSRINCPGIQAPEVPDEALYAGRMTAQAVRTIGELKDRPFLLAVGYRRPHLPLVAPRKYFDLYPPRAITLPEHREPPAAVPIWSIYNSVTYWHPRMRETWNVDVQIPKFPTSLDEALRYAGFELRSYRGIPTDGALTDELQQEVWQAYMACVSYVDAQIGRLLEALETNGLSKKTIVVLWGDHGWHLGEHGTWCKMTVFEWASRVPLILSAPGFQSNRIESLAELIDVYPTLCELTGLSIPKHVEGDSLVPVMRKSDRPWKKAAFSEFPRFGHSMGRSMRTDRYRYTEWVSPNGAVKGRELYDHATDPLELVNRASSPDASATVQKLATQLKRGWRAARPR